MLDRDSSLLFNDDHRAFREIVRKFIAREFTPGSRSSKKPAK